MTYGIYSKLLTILMLVLVGLSGATASIDENVGLMPSGQSSSPDRWSVANVTVSGSALNESLQITAGNSFNASSLIYGSATISKTNITDGSVTWYDAGIEQFDADQASATTTGARVATGWNQVDNSEIIGFRVATSLASDQASIDYQATVYLTSNITNFQNSYIASWYVWDLTYWSTIYTQYTANEDQGLYFFLNSAIDSYGVVNGSFTLQDGGKYYVVFEGNSAASDNIEIDILLNISNHSSDFLLCCRVS